MKWDSKKERKRCAALSSQQTFSLPEGLSLKIEDKMIGLVLMVYVLRIGIDDPALFASIAKLVRLDVSVVDLAAAIGLNLKGPDWESASARLSSASKGSFLSDAEEHKRSSIFFEERFPGVCIEGRVTHFTSICPFCGTSSELELGATGSFFCLGCERYFPNLRDTFQAMFVFSARRQSKL